MKNAKVTVRTIDDAGKRSEFLSFIVAPADVAAVLQHAASRQDAASQLGIEIIVEYVDAAVDTAGEALRGELDANW